MDGAPLDVKSDTKYNSFFFLLSKCDENDKTYLERGGRKWGTIVFLAALIILLYIIDGIILLAFRLMLPSKHVEAIGDFNF